MLIQLRWTDPILVMQWSGELPESLDGMIIQSPQTHIVQHIDKRCWSQVLGFVIVQER